MPYGYLITVFVWGTATAAMLRPPYRPIPLARLTSFLSVALNELPVLALLLFGLATAHAVSTGVQSTPLGIVALGTAAMICLGMLSLQRDVHRARGAVERTIGLTAGKRSFHWTHLLPLALRPRIVERRANLPYSDDRRHRLDLYRRRDLRQPAPVLIYLHGGGYAGGSKRFESSLLRRRLAERGWVVLSANYRLRPRASWPDHLVDAKRVIAWAHDHAAEHGLDPRRIVMAGSSAGAHLAVHCALTARDPLLQPGFEEIDTRLAAAVGLYGYYGRYDGGDPGGRPASDPRDLPAEDAPPVVLVHGDRDTYVPVHQARDLADHLRRGSRRRVAYVELPGAQHGFDVFASPRNRAVVDGIDHFLATEVPAL